MQPGEICYDFKKARQKKLRLDKRKILKHQTSQIVAKNFAQWKVKEDRKRYNKAAQIKKEQKVLNMAEFEKIRDAACNPDKDPEQDKLNEEARKRMKIF